MADAPHRSKGTQMNEPKPPNFDWITARQGCSPSSVFEALLAGVRDNVSKYREFHPASGVELASRGSNAFSVIVPHHYGTRSVRFHLDHIGVIKIEGPGVSLTAVVTLNDDAECRLKVNGQEQELEEWQVLRRALESVFFDPEG